MVQVLLAAATPQQLDGEYGFSAAQFAVTRRASPSMLQQLLDAGAAACDSSDIASILRRAAQFVSAEVVGSLLSMLAPAEQGSTDGTSSTSTAGGRPAGAITDALKAAVIGGRVEVAELLLQTRHPELCRQDTQSCYRPGARKPPCTVPFSATTLRWWACC